MMLKRKETRAITERRSKDDDDRATDTTNEGGN